MISSLKYSLSDCRLAFKADLGVSVLKVPSVDWQRSFILRIGWVFRSRQVVRQCFCEQPLVLYAGRAENYFLEGLCVGWSNSAGILSRRHSFVGRHIGYLA